MDVWDRLGIEKTDDQRAIKRAYAKQLKAIRPDEDPAEFQALREARDEAIYLSQFDYEWDEEECESDEYFEPDEASADPQTEISPDNQVLEPSIRTDDPLEQALQESEPKSDETYVITLDETTVADETSKEFVDTSPNLNSVEANPPQNDPNTSSEDEAEVNLGFYDVEIDAITYEQINAQLEDLMGPWALWDEAAWVKFIRRIRDCSFDLSNYAEYEIMHLLGENLAEKKQESALQREARRSILQFLNNEFGWTQNDRRVYAVLASERAEALMDLLRYGEEGSSSGSSETFYDAFGFPLLTAQHFKDYLGKNDSVYEKYYQKSLDEGRELKPSWSWPGFLFSPLWLAHRCNDGMEALTGMIYVLALIILHYGQTSPSLIASLLGSLMILSTHILVGVFGKKLVVTTLANSLQELHNDPKLSEQERLKKLAFIGQGGFKALFDFIVGMAGIGVIAVIIYRLLI